ncbi:MAG: peptide chain release factor 1 [Planctomycetota bacterium]
MLEKLEEIEKRYKELDNLLATPEVARDSHKLQKLSRERGALAKIVAVYSEYKKVIKEIEDAKSILSDENAEEELTELANEELKEKESKKEELYDKLVRFLVTDTDEATRNAIVEIRAGIGGEEAALFAADLFRMYMRYSQEQGWKVEVMDSTATERSGFREIIFSVIGNGAYEKLKFESGGHRVQRVPLTEASGRIHTSAVTVAVLQEAEEVEVDIPEQDLRIERITGGGPGGQSVNKTASAVRVTHLPTGFIARCQDERSQRQNLEKAMRVIRSKIYEIAKEKAESDRAQLRRSMIKTGSRSEKVRTYNFPQNRVTDHRIGLSLYNLQNFLAGEILEMIEALEKADKEERIKLLSMKPKSSSDVNKTSGES